MDKAIEEHEKAVELSGRSNAELSFLGAAFAEAGRRAEAMKILQELEERATRQYVPAFARVWTLQRLGNIEQAFVWLEKVFDERSSFLSFLKVHPLFDSLRSDPRFQSLLRRLDFPE
jgi:tetratricopeptide (TPR) repeat protein